MNSEDAIKLINEGKVDEAYMYFKDSYETNKDLTDKYYMLMIEFHYYNNWSPNDLIDEFKTLLQLPPYMHKGVLIPLISLSLDMGRFEDVIEYCDKALNINIDMALIYAAKAKALFMLDYLEEALVYINRALNHDEQNIDIQAFCFETKMNILLRQEKNDEANNLVNQMYLKFGSQSFIDYEKLQLLLVLSASEEEIKETYDHLKGTNEEIRANRLLFDYYFSKAKAQKIIEYGNLILTEPNLSNEEKYICNMRIAFAYRSIKNVDLAIEIMQSTLQYGTHISDIYYNLGETYYYMDDLNSFYKALECFKKGYELEQSLSFANYIADTYFLLGNLEEVLNWIKLSQKQAKAEKNDYYLHLFAKYYTCLGQFDLAEKYLNKAYSKKVITEDVFYSTLYRVAKNPIKAIRYLGTAIANDIVEGKAKASAYFHGEYNIEVNEEKSQLLALENLKEKTSCTLSMYGNVLLKSEPQKAYQAFLEGSELYFMEKDACPCAVAFLAYCYYAGVSVTKDTNKALELLEKAITKSGINCTENVINLYAYICLMENKNIFNAYKMLQGFFERRYQVSSLYVLVLISDALKLEQDFKKYKKKFWEALVYASAKEFDYYKGSPTVPYLNNN